MWLKAARDQWYLLLDLDPRGVSKEVFFSSDWINMLAKASISIKDAADIDRVLGVNFHLNNSLIASYSVEILRQLQDAVREHQQQDVNLNHASSQAKTQKKTEPALKAWRKCKYDVAPTPEEQFDLSNPADVERLDRQRQLQAYDQAVDERRNERRQVTQRKQAEQTVDKRSKQKVTKKQAATTRTSTKESGRKGKNTGNK
jgi:hypothetical protein